MGPKPQSKKTLPVNASPGTIKTESSKNPEKPAKKGRKRKNPIPAEETVQTNHTGPGRPRKKKKNSGEESTSAVTTNVPTKTPTSTTAIKKVQADEKVAEQPKPKKKYEKLTKEEREARKLKKKQATEEAKRIKKQLKARSAPKPRDIRPADVERQCGVALEGGGFCQRSLTCKTHSMGAKRAVPGRSKPYDVLLLAYQKRNQVKLAEQSTQQQLELENEALSENNPLNEDEEVEQVLHGVHCARPVPMERRVIVPIRYKSNFIRMRELLLKSLTKTPPMSTLVQAVPQANNLLQPLTISPSPSPSFTIPTTTEESSSTKSNSTMTRPQSASTRPNMAEIMSNTTNIYGRTIVFDSANIPYIRPSQSLYSSNIISQLNQLRAKQSRQMEMQQMATQIQASASNGAPFQSSSPPPMTASKSFNQ